MLNDQAFKNLKDLEDQIEELKGEKTCCSEIPMFINAAKNRNYMFWFW